MIFSSTDIGFSIGPWGNKVSARCCWQVGQTCSITLQPDSDPKIFSFCASLFRRLSSRNAASRVSVAACCSCSRSSSSNNSPAINSRWARVFCATSNCELAATDASPAVSTGANSRRLSSLLSDAKAFSKAVHAPSRKISIEGTVESGHCADGCSGTLSSKTKYIKYSNKGFLQNSEEKKFFYDENGRTIRIVETGQLKRSIIKEIHYCNGDNILSVPKIATLLAALNLHPPEVAKSTSRIELTYHSDIGSMDRKVEARTVVEFYEGEMLRLVASTEGDKPSWRCFTPTSFF